MKNLRKTTPFGLLAVQKEETRLFQRGLFLDVLSSNCARVCKKHPKLHRTCFFTTSRIAEAQGVGVDPARDAAPAVAGRDDLVANDVWVEKDCVFVFLVFFSIGIFKYLKIF